MSEEKQRPIMNAIALLKSSECFSGKALVIADFKRAVDRVLEY